MMKVKKMISLAISLILVLTMLGACSAPANTAGTATDDGKKGGSTSGQVELTFWYFAATGYDELAKQYEQKNPNVKIKVQKMEYNALHDGLFTAISSGAGAPDVVMIDTIQVERYRNAQDKFYNLYDYGAKEVKSKYLDWKWAYSESADKKFLFGLPTDIGPTVLYYRPDLFEKAGLPSKPDDVKAALNTWDKFADAGRKYTAATGKPFADAVEPIYNAIRDQGDKLYFEQDGKFIGDVNPQNKKAFDYAAKGLKEGWIGKTKSITTEWSAALGKDEFAAVIGPGWMIGYLKGNAPDSKGKFRVTNMPERAGNNGGSAFVLPKQGKHAKESYAFSEWMLAPEQQLKSFKDYGLFPSAVTVYDLADFLSYKEPYFSGQEIAPVFKEAANTVKPNWFGTLYKDSEKQYSNGLRSLTADKNLDPEKLWADANKAIKDIISRQ
jgi:cellobiose transport system substrate-binding protein